MHWSSKRHAHIDTHHLLSHAVTSPQSHLAAAGSAAVASAALGAAAVVVGGCRCCGVPESKAALLSVSSMAARESTSRRPCPSEDCCTKLWICLKWPGSTRQVTTICTDCHTTPKSALCIAWQKCHVWASCMLKLRLHLNRGKVSVICRFMCCARGEKGNQTGMWCCFVHILHGVVGACCSNARWYVCQCMRVML